MTLSVNNQIIAQRQCSNTNTNTMRNTKTNTKTTTKANTKTKHRNDYSSGIVFKKNRSTNGTIMA